MTQAEPDRRCRRAGRLSWRVRREEPRALARKHAPAPTPATCTCTTCTPHAHEHAEHCMCQAWRALRDGRHVGEGGRPRPGPSPDPDPDPDPDPARLLPSLTASMATRRSACTAATTTGSSKAARAHSAPRLRQLAASRLESPSRAHTAALPSGLRSRATAAWAPAVHSRRAVAEAPPKGPVPLPFYHQVRSRTGQAADDAPR